MQFSHESMARESHVLAKANRAGTVFRLLIYGDLEPTSEHLLRLRGRLWDVVLLKASCAIEKVRHLIANCDAVFVNNVDINPLLEDIGVQRICVLAATGYSFVDIHRARTLGVRIARLVDYSVPAVVEYMLTAALGALRPLNTASNRVKQNDWSKADHIGRELAHRRAGVIGCGKIGQQIISRLRGLNLQISCTTRSPTQQRPNFESGDVAWQDIDALMSESDVIFVCCDSNSTSNTLLNRNRLAKMKQGAMLISISPNPVIDLASLAEILRERTDLRAVLDLDPLPVGHELLARTNITITPHIAFATVETIYRRFEECIDTLFEAMDGQPVEWISPSGAKVALPWALSR
jgi:D-3-phosphoglycerate dehydrogenase